MMSDPTRRQLRANPYPPTPSPSASSRSSPGALLDLLFLKATGFALIVYEVAGSELGLMGGGQGRFGVFGGGLLLLTLKQATSLTGPLIRLLSGGRR